MKTDTELSLTEAADATGKARSTIFKACKKGALSYRRDDENNQMYIEPGELFRVFKPLGTVQPDVSGNVEKNASDETQKTAGNSDGNSALAVEVKFLHEKIALLDKLRADEVAQLSARIEELRRDKDDWRAERQQLLDTMKEYATGLRLLTDQRQARSSSDPADMKAAAEAPQQTAGGRRRKFLGLF